MSRRRKGASWGLCLLGACGLQTAFGPAPRSRGDEPPPRPSPSPAAGAPSAQPEPEVLSVKQLAERLRAMEEMNKKLAEELARSRREHDQQMTLILQKFGELAAKPGNRKGDAAPG